MSIIIVKKIKSRFYPKKMDNLLFKEKKIKNYNGFRGFLYIAQTKISNFFKKFFEIFE